MLAEEEEEDEAEKEESCGTPPRGNNANKGRYD